MMAAEAVVDSTEELALTIEVFHKAVLDMSIQKKPRPSILRDVY